MTDNEIIKEATEAYNQNLGAGCYVGDLLGIISRQNAEIDDLKRDTIPKLQYGLERANKYGIEADKENERLKAEIERLDKFVITQRKEIDRLYDYIQYTEAEARKEFAERLKVKEAVHFCKCGQPFVYTDLFNGEIDNLLTEMEEET